MYHVLNRANARLPIFDKPGDDDHFYTVARYVERNAQRARLAKRAEACRGVAVGKRLADGKRDEPDKRTDVSK